MWNTQSIVPISWSEEKLQTLGISWVGHLTKHPNTEHMDPNGIDSWVVTTVNESTHWQLGMKKGKLSGPHWHSIGWHMEIMNGQSQRPMCRNLCTDKRKEIVIGNTQKDCTNRHKTFMFFIFILQNNLWFYLKRNYFKSFVLL